MTDEMTILQLGAKQACGSAFILERVRKAVFAGIQPSYGTERFMVSRKGFLKGVTIQSSE